MSQPAVIFVPGAWHSPDCFHKVITLLSAKGFTTRKVDLPSVGRSPPVSSLEPDAEAIRTAALAEMQNGHDVTVVCHSYGGIPTSQALKGLDKPQNAGEGRVSAIVYIAAYLLPENVTLGAATAAHGGGALGPYIEPLGDGNNFFKNDSNLAEGLYNDLSPEEGRHWVSKLRPHAAATFSTPGNYAAWKDIPAWYLIAQQDQAIKAEAQRAFVQEAREYLDRVGGPGAGERMLRSEEIDASHSPFLSRPRETADFIERACAAWRK
jgi:pimeloyl-ACP methyl ester carboxylesterase